MRLGHGRLVGNAQPNLAARFPWEFEQTALSFDGVTKCYAIQAGRELRVLVDAENVSDDYAGTLSSDISRKIETEMQYPGQIKVTVIREMRAVSFAK